MAAWRRGERPLVEDILANQPGLSEDDVIRLVYEEVCLRFEAGMPVDSAAILDRFPQWRAQLEILLDCQIRLESAVGLAAPAVPEVGETVAGFHLLAELGRGLAGTVFLASQPSLAERPVVLKIIQRGRLEHFSLARLQHMNIVPLYSEHVLQARNLQILCMPFLGGATLARVLESFEGLPAHSRTGKQLIDALDRIEGALPIASPAQGPFRNHLARATYVDALCAIGAGLADGLHYAHERGLVHMDVKPSNVLLADDGQPMLLDFHLARGSIRPGDPPPAWLGGTPLAMAPEQELAVRSVREGRRITQGVDARADVFALGLLLYEALGGPPRESSASPLPPLHTFNPCVSHGLSDVVQRCLATDPRARYRDAAALATDLRCHLADLPLRGVPNRSFAERWRKWRRRRPLALSRTLLLTLCLLAAGLIWAGFRQHVGQIQSALDDGRALLKRGRDAEAVVALRHGLALTSHVPFVSSHARALSQGLATASRQEKAAELHRLADMVRFRYAIAVPHPDEARWLVARGREIWQARGALTRPADGLSRPELDENIRRDMLDILSLWTDLRIRLAAEDEREDARREVRQALAEADAELGSAPSLAASRETPARPAEKPTLTAWEHDDLGRKFLRSGRLNLAADQFQQGLELQPQDFWLNFHAGLCDYRLGKHSEAIAAFHACVVLSPETAECYYNRGLAYQEIGNLSRAMQDYGKALTLNPKLADAALNRGILHYRQGEFDQAAADLERALAAESSARLRGDIHYNRALVEIARDHPALALEHGQAALRAGHTQAAALVRRLEVGR